MCVTHNNIARGDSLIAFASLTISAKSIKIRLSHNLSNLFCENCAFFVKWQWVKSHIRKRSQQSYLLEKIILFLGLLLFFSNFFLYIHLAVVLFFLCSHILGKGMFFFQKGDYLFFVYFVMFSKGIIRLFLKYNNQKIMEREEIERSKWKNEAFKIASKKVYFELETDLYLAKIFDFEFQHHDHQTSL